MAFFGLTALGSQNPFDLCKETPIYVFDEKDWQHAFMQTHQPGFTEYSECEKEVEAAQQVMKTATITYNQLPILLQYLYNCPKDVNNVPESSQRYLLDGFEQAGLTANAISLPLFLKEVTTICKRAEDDDTKKNRYGYMKDGIKTREYTSNIEYRATLAKHHRMEMNPRDKNLLPMTDSQTLGWSKPTIVIERRPNKSCEETLFASAMVKAGVHYY